MLKLIARMSKHFTEFPSCLKNLYMYNYFNDSKKLFSDLYLSTILNNLANSIFFFRVNIIMVYIYE